MSLGRFLRDLVIVLAGAGLLVWGVTRWLAVPFAVEGPSMEPTLADGERVLVDLWTLRGRLPRAGDVVVISGPEGENIVKRVVRDPSPGAGPVPSPQMEADSPLELSFIVLGDNLPESRDSRAFGRVPLHRIRGKVIFRYWPPARMGSIE